ncbi:hypothetical protein HN713_01160 [bacterium]|nr:hypothetical protein [bacterium]
MIGMEPLEFAPGVKHPTFLVFFLMKADTVGTPYNLESQWGNVFVSDLKKVNTFPEKYLGG